MYVARQKFVHVSRGEVSSSLANSGAYTLVSLRPILWRMTRRLHNWTYLNVTDFLMANGFTFFREEGGSHQSWIKRGENGLPNIIVGVHFTRTSYLVKTVKRIIKQSGIDEEEWIKWASS
jgi:hypothetical protein